MPTPVRITADDVRRDLAAYIRRQLNLSEDRPLPTDLQTLVDSTAEGIAEIANYINARTLVPTDVQEQIIKAVKGFEQQSNGH